MKIAFVSTILAYAWGGADTLWTHAAEAALRRGDKVFLALSPLTSAHARVQALLQGGATLHPRVPPAPSHGIAQRIQGKIQSYLGTRDPLVNALRDFAPDLVIFSCGGTYDLVLETNTLGWLKSKQIPFRFVANWQTEHPVLEAQEFAKAIEAFAAAEAVFFVSTRNLEITRRHLGTPLPHARAIQNPLRIDPTHFVPPPWPDETKWRLATVGRLEPVKGIDLLTTALSRVLGDNPDWQLNVYGDGPQKNDLLNFFQTHGLSNRAIFRGYQPDLAAIWKENHLLVSPARDEGVPMTIPEAMLCARPVLATGVGGATDWITDDVTGFICPEPRLESLNAALDRAWSRRKSWHELGSQARRAASAHYKPDDYLRIIATPSPRSC